MRSWAGYLLAVLVETSALALGFVQRTMPQFNFLSTGAPVRVVLGLVVIAFVLSLPVLVAAASLARPSNSAATSACEAK